MGNKDKRLKELTRILTLALALFSISNGALADKIWEYDQLFSAAEKIKKEEIEPLHLAGKTIRSAMQMMLNQGYSCGMPPPIVGFGEFNGILCNKHTSEEHCDSASVILNPDWDAKVSTRKRLTQFDTAKVESTTILCHLPNYLPVEYLTYRESAEQNLNEVVENYALNGVNANSVYEKLLNEGFLCGTQFNEPNNLKINCSKLNPDIKYCYDASINLELDWSEPTSDKAETLQQLNSATVKKVDSSCLIPNLQPKFKNDI